MTDLRRAFDTLDFPAPPAPAPEGTGTVTLLVFEEADPDSAVEDAVEALAAGPVLRLLVQEGAEAGFLARLGAVVARRFAFGEAPGLKPGLAPSDPLFSQPPAGPAILAMSFRTTAEALSLAAALPPGDEARIWCEAGARALEAALGLGEMVVRVNGAGAGWGDAALRADARGRTIWLPVGG